MNYKIVSDSSSNVRKLDKVPFDCVPLHIIVGERHFVDDANLDLEDMLTTLKEYKGSTSTSCPSPQDWISAFGDADTVFCVTITSNLSGAYNSAAIAKQMYEEEHPGRVVHLFDSLSTGPEMALVIEKLEELLLAGKDAAQIDIEVREYMKKTHLFFSLASLNNLARNGRVSPLIAKGIGILGIRIIAKASEEGTIKPMDKAKGDKRAISCLVAHIKAQGYTNGRIIISHTGNEASANQLKDALTAEFGQFNGSICENTGLCSYYAEPQCLMIGFEA